MTGNKEKAVFITFFLQRTFQSNLIASTEHTSLQKIYGHSEKGVKKQHFVKTNRTA